MASLVALHPRAYLFICIFCANDRGQRTPRRHTNPGVRLEKNDEAALGSLATIDPPMQNGRTFRSPSSHSLPPQDSTGHILPITWPPGRVVTIMTTTCARGTALIAIIKSPGIWRGLVNYASGCKVNAVLVPYSVAPPNVFIFLPKHKQLQPQYPAHDRPVAQSSLCISIEARDSAALLSHPQLERRFPETLPSTSYWSHQE